jgi:hypothetical protein
VATKKCTIDFGSKVTYRPIQDGGSRHYEKIQTAITQSIFVWFQWNLMSSFATSSHSENATPEVTDRFQDGRRCHVANSSECYKVGNYHPILMQIGTQTKKNMLSSKLIIPEV